MANKESLIVTGDLINKNLKKYKSIFNPKIEDILKVENWVKK